MLMGWAVRVKMQQVAPFRRGKATVLASKNGWPMRFPIKPLLLAACLFFPAHSNPLTEQRKIPLQGATNTRELGDIPVRGGRVRAGWVYRSNALYTLTESDVERLKRADIRAVVDFRMEPDHSQKADRPDFVEGLDHVYWLPMTLTTSPSGYRTMPDKFPTQFRQLFEVFADEDNYPLIYHCAEGKDRTGIATALLLELLGADRQVILDDYMASQDNGPRFVVDAEWIKGSLAGVDADGGIENYLERRGVPRAQQEAIRQLLIVPDP